MVSSLLHLQRINLLGHAECHFDRRSTHLVGAELESVGLWTLERREELHNANFVGFQLPVQWFNNGLGRTLRIMVE